MWSFVKKAWKVVKRVVKAVVRVVVRAVFTVLGFVFGIFDLLLGFLAWPPKKLRLHIAILSTQNGPLVSPQNLTPAIDYAKRVLKDRFNVKLLPYARSMVQIIEKPAPEAALSVGCGLDAWGDEFGEAGEFFASHVAGWNASPVEGTFPITVFIVRDVKGKNGCSLGPFSDYVVLDIDGALVENVMMHEMGHSCNLWHSGSRSNLMWHDINRGDKVKWFQKNLLRSSRHVLYW